VTGGEIESLEPNQIPEDQWGEDDLADVGSGLILTEQRGGNALFLSVRPDWRDSKSLLGYFNPLTGFYESPPFLRFLMRAIESYRAADGLAWFVILDEMNLAHVEYYFADLLSVLESGRDEQGWTREAVRIGYPDDADGDVPPREIQLPPNLYVVGTVNMDETTHAFSPKVLDRAFTIELTEVDFSDYPVTPDELDGPRLDPAARVALLNAFTDDGRFPRIDKASIARHVDAHPELRQRLQLLNERLRPFGFHFGYRVFDEIVAFCDAADRNQTFTDLGGSDAAFDAAVLMKVLPKFHGSRARLESPLRAVLGWCVDPEQPDDASIDAALKAADADAITAELKELDDRCRCPRTFDRARRMLWTLQTDGFAAFG
jgi:5-methylcytosine-specific restriction endonuclease McrBC GTP-binding regulatory subunit McrB